MNIIKKISIAFMLLLPISQAFSVQLIENDQTGAYEGVTSSNVNRITDILNAFIELGQLSDDVEYCKVIELPVGKTTYAKEIIFVKNNESSKVIKTFKKVDDYEKEISTLEEDRVLVNYINQFPGIDKVNIPKIIVSSGFYRDDNNSIWAVIQNEAKGKQLGEYDLLNMQDDDIRNLYQAVGRIIGNLDQFLYNSGQILLFHPDFNSYNVFYDNETDTLYWIDVAGIAKKYNEKKEKESTMRIVSLFGNYTMTSYMDVVRIERAEQERRKFIKNMGIGFYKHPIKEIVDKMKNMISINKKIIFAPKGFGEGYVSAHPEAKDIYNMGISNSGIFKDNQEISTYRKIFGYSEEPEEDFVGLLVQ